MFSYKSNIKIVIVCDKFGDWIENKGFYKYFQMISDRTLISGQENKFNSKDKKLVKSRIWPEIFNQKVDKRKVNC